MERTKWETPPFCDGKRSFFARIIEDVRIAKLVKIFFIDKYFTPIPPPIDYV